MLPVKTILAKLEGVGEWPDGESIADIRERLTSGQLEAPGKLVVRITEYQKQPFLLSGRVLVEQQSAPLCEVKRRLTGLTHKDIEQITANWQESGYLEAINISYR